MSEKDRRRKAFDKLPPTNRIPESLVNRSVLNITEFGVASWCPTPDGTGPKEAVVLHFKISSGIEDIEFGLRLKTPRAVDELIAMLERHRNDVWPNPGELDASNS